MSKLRDLLNEKLLSKVEEIIKGKMSSSYDLRKSFNTYPNSFDRLFQAMCEGIPDSSKGGTRDITTQEVIEAVRSMDQSDTDQNTYLDELFKEGQIKPSLNQQLQDLRKAGFGTPEGQEIAKNIVSHPAYVDLVDRLNEVLTRTRAEQYKYLDENGRMYPVVLALAREKIEETGFGCFIAKINPNRRLYAVLKPTSMENYLRIRAVLKCAYDVLDPQEYEHFMQSLSDYNWAVRIANQYDSGQISYEAAKDMLDKVFES